MLYGLKQAGQEWNIEFDSKLRKRGYEQLCSDACIYIWYTENDFVIIAVWVDDTLIFATMTELRDRAQTDIKEEWEVTDLGKLTKIVSIEITKCPTKSQFLLADI